jgi:hypothetical protein
VATMYPERFANVADTISYSFSLKQMEAQFEQSLRVPLSMGVGADYAHDHLGYGVSPKDPGSIRIRTLAVETTAALLEAEVTEAGNECFRIGKGYLYRLGTDGSTRRKCLARLRSMPSVTINGSFQFGATPLIFDFVQLSDWMATSATSSSQVIDSPNESVTINNTGDLSTPVVFRLRNTGTQRAEHPIIFNTTTGEYAAFDRAMNVASHELYLDTESLLVQFSDTDGASYQNDYSNYAGTLSNLQPGNNVLKVCCGRPHILPWLNTIGDPDFTLEWSYTLRYV